MLNQNQDPIHQTQEVVLANKEQLALCSDVLSQPNVTSFFPAENVIKSCDLFEKKNLILYRIEEITFEEDSPRLEALENVLSCMSVPGVNLVYLILGDKNTGGVQFYFGFSRDEATIHRATDSIIGLGEAFIKPALIGNFRGSSVKELSGDEIERIHGIVSKFVENSDCSTFLSGVPGWVKDKEKQDFRGIDRLVDVMQGDDFGFLVVAKPLENAKITDLRRDIFETYGLLSAVSKHSIQIGFNNGINKNIAVNTGLSITTGKTLTVSTSRNESESFGENWSHNGERKSHGKNKGWQYGSGSSESEAENEGVQINEGKNESEGVQHGTSITASYDFTNKSAADWVKYFDDVLIPRLDYARGKGAFVVNTVLLGGNPQVVHKLSNVARSIFSGETANMVPLTLVQTQETKIKRYIFNFSIPLGEVTGEIEKRLPFVHAGLLGYSEKARIDKTLKNVLYYGNWMSVRELALMAGLPQKEVIGLRLKEEVEFGLNIPEDEKKADDSQIKLGHLIKSGVECDNASICLDKSLLDRHVFVSGVTGSGKTTTCQTLLLSSGRPFIVIEPAKTEYRALRFSEYPKEHEKEGKLCPDLLVFTLGDDMVAPFRLNPFELIPGESISSRVDMLMASISAAFDMEAAIPQIIERAIYECYADYGWDIETNQNKHYRVYSLEDKNNYAGTPFEDGVFAFPTLSEVLKKTESVVEEQGFDERLKKDYIGSIKARLQGLTIGAKGFMLDCQRSIDFMSLLDKKVVFELESIPDAAQKSLVIGFILTNLMQAIKKKFYDKGGKKIEHITLIEEAHRLLSKFTPGDNPSRKQAAETFADMLAEIRKYGEALVIADQIPSKLTPEVIKNTNTKIIHRLFAKDDKDTVGNTMGLEEEQANFLSNLRAGRAIVFNGNWPKAVQVQITQSFDTSSSMREDEIKNLHQASMEFYVSQAKRGVYAYSEFLSKQPKCEDMEDQAKRTKKIKDEFVLIISVNYKKYKREDFPNLLSFVEREGIEWTVRSLENRFYKTTLKANVREAFKHFFETLVGKRSNDDFSEDWLMLKTSGEDYLKAFFK